MAEEKDIKIKLTGDTSDVDAKVDESSKNISKKFEDTSQEVSKSAEKMGDALKTGIGTALLMVSKEIDTKFTEVIRAGIAELSTIDRYTAVVQRTAKSFTTQELEKFIGDLQRLTGISDNELRQALMRAYMITGDMNKAFEATRLAADIGATGLMDVGSSARAIAQALSGTTFGLMMLARNLGLIVPEGASADEILSLLTEKVGNLGEVIHSKTSGRIENLKLELGDLKEYFGRLTIEGLNPFINTMDDAVKSLNNFIGRAVEGESVLGDFLSGFLGVSSVAVKGFSIAGDALNKFINLLILGSLTGGTLATVAKSITSAFIPAAGAIGVVSGALAVLVGLKKSVVDWAEGLMKGNKEIGTSAEEQVKKINQLSLDAEKQAEKHQQNMERIARKTMQTVSPEVEMAYRLIGYEGYEKERLQIKLEYEKKIEEAMKQGRTKEAQQLKELMDWEIYLVNQREAKEKELADQRLREQAQTIKDYIATAKMSEEEKAVFELNREIEKYQELVRQGKLTEDELATYKKLKLEEIYKENMKQEDSWAKSQLVGVTGKWFEELTGMSFMNRVNKLNLILDVNLRGINVKDGIDDNTARIIGNSIANQLGSQLGGSNWLL